MDIRLTPALDFTPKTYINEFGPELIMQRVRLRLSVHRGEWFQDPERGLPWFDWLGRRNLTDAEILDEIRRQILLTSGVVAVLSLSLDRQDGKFLISGRVLVRASDLEKALDFGIETWGVGRVRVF